MTVRIIDFQKEYDGQIVVDIPCLTITNPQCFGLAGINGAGKTTLLRSILDLINIDRGSIYIDEQNVAKTEEWKSNTSSYFGESFIIDFLTPEEFFLFVGSTYGMKKTEVHASLSKYTDFLSMIEIKDKLKLIRDLSSGTLQKVGLIAALMVKPRLLILDEPFNHLDPTAQQKFKMILRKIIGTGRTTILISSHSISHLADICDRIAIMNKGRIVQDLETDKHTMSKLTEYFTGQGA
jgi:ABC-2 type transport system ATP-binding protein